jgi:hypothetical protein
MDPLRKAVLLANLASTLTLKSGGAGEDRSALQKV